MVVQTGRIPDKTSGKGRPNFLFSREIISGEINAPISPGTQRSKFFASGPKLCQNMGTSWGVAYVVLPESFAGSFLASHPFCLRPIDCVMGAGFPPRTSSDQAAAAADDRSSGARRNLGRS